MSEQSNPLRLLHPWQVALLLGVSTRTLERHRAHGTGAEYVKVGNRIRYFEPAVLDYLKKNTVRTDQSVDPPGETGSLAELQALLEELNAVLSPGGD